MRGCRQHRAGFGSRAFWLPPYPFTPKHWTSHCRSQSLRFARTLAHRSSPRPAPVSKARDSEPPGEVRPRLPVSMTHLFSQSHMHPVTSPTDKARWPILSPRPQRLLSHERTGWRRGVCVRLKRCQPRALATDRRVMAQPGPWLTSPITSTRLRRRRPRPRASPAPTHLLLHPSQPCHAAGLHWTPLSPWRRSMTRTVPLRWQPFNRSVTVSESTSGWSM